MTNMYLISISIHYISEKEEIKKRLMADNKKDDPLWFYGEYRREEWTECMLYIELLLLLN